MSETNASRKNLRLRWRTSRLGLALPVFLLGAGLFLWFGLHPQAMADASSRRAAFFQMLAPFTIGGVNIPALVIMLWSGWFAYKAAWRWADEVAVAATEEGLEPHKSLFFARMRWSEISDVRFARAMGADCLMVTLKDGRVRRIPAVDNRDEIAVDFAAAARSRLSTAERTAD